MDLEGLAPWQPGNNGTGTGTGTFNAVFVIGSFQYDV
jgi:hypothetical protein